jgi:hypothetical protein
LSIRSQSNAIYPLAKDPDEETRERYVFASLSKTPSGRIQDIENRDIQHMIAEPYATLHSMITTPQFI